MAIALADLVARLTADVPPSGGRPSATQYENAIKDAVTDFNNRVGLRRRAPLAIVNGTATYTLPADFTSFIEFSSLPTFDGRVAISSDGIIPLAAATGLSSEEYEVVAGQMTIYPTPTYSGTRYLWYRAGHYLDDDDEYPNMTDADASIIMLKARATAWRVYGEGVTQGMSYSFGAVKIEKKPTFVGDTISGRAQKLEGEYEDAVKARIGAVVRQTRYTMLDASLFMNDL